MAKYKGLEITCGPSRLHYSIISSRFSKPMFVQSRDTDTCVQVLPPRSQLCHCNLKASKIYLKNGFIYRSSRSHKEMRNSDLSFHSLSHIMSKHQPLEKDGAYQKQTTSDIEKNTQTTLCHHLLAHSYLNEIRADRIR